MFKNHTTYGKLNVKKEKIPFLVALTELDAIKTWFGGDISHSNDQVLFIKDVFSGNSNNLHLSIKKLKNSKIEWNCSFERFEILISFTCSNNTLEIEINCKEYGIDTFIQEWIYALYRLQEFVEQGKVKSPRFEYNTSDKTSILVSIEINSSSAIIFSHLTEKFYLQQIFSRYPECDLESLHYSWGWIDEGPNNLISWKRNSVLIHDFIIDFNPIGYIKWDLDEISEQKCIVTLTHNDIDLEDEIHPDNAYYSYKNGWLYFLAKIRDLTENKSFTLYFEDELVD